MPEHVTKVNWFDTFAEMVAVRDAIDADPILSTRVDTMVGVEFSLQQRRLDWLLIEHLLEPMIVTTRTYEFDELFAEPQPAAEGSAVVVFQTDKDITTVLPALRTLLGELTSVESSWSENGRP